MRGRLKAAAVCAAVVVGFTAIANEKPSPEYQAAMKNLGAANAGMRGDVTNKDYAAIEKHAATYKASFTVADNYWSGKKVDDAMKLAKDGLKGAADLETAARAKNDEGIAMAQRGIGATCRGCHMAHREQLPDMSYEIK